MVGVLLHAVSLLVTVVHVNVILLTPHGYRHIVFHVSSRSLTPLSPAPAATNLEPSDPLSGSPEPASDVSISETAPCFSSFTR
jgi:hypothetical protein